MWEKNFKNNGYTNNGTNNCKNRRNIIEEFSLEKINKIDKLLARITKKKNTHTHTYI